MQKQKVYSQSKLNFLNEKMRKNQSKELQQDTSEEDQEYKSEEIEGQENESQEIEEDQEKKSIKEYKFQESWLQDYLWLKYESRDQSNTQLMYCTYCQQYKKYLKDSNISEYFNNTFIKGSNRLRSIALTEHVESQNHKKAATYVQKRSQKGANIFEVRTREHINNDLFKPLFSSQYYICKNKIALNNYPSLVHLFGYLKVQSTENYLNNTGGKEILYCISSNIKQQLIKTIKHSCLPIGIALDTKVNRTNQKIMAVSIKYIDALYNPNETFITLVELKQKNAETIYIELIRILEEYELMDVLHFISTDGEITLTSLKNGVIGRMLKKLPWIIHIHCRAHIANLGLADIIKNFELLKTNNKTIYKICKVFKSNKQRKLKLLNKQQEQNQGLIDNSDGESDSNIEAENQQVINISQPLDIRWISYLPSAEQIIKYYDQIYQEISKIKKQNILNFYQKLANQILSTFFKSIL
ncbi:hypothetical protein ABPG72_008922 [Tetrahymena utriculariae]